MKVCAFIFLLFATTQGFIWTTTFSSSSFYFTGSETELDVGIFTNSPVDNILGLGIFFVDVDSIVSVTPLSGFLPSSTAEIQNWRSSVVISGLAPSQGMYHFTVVFKTKIQECTLSLKSFYLDSDNIPNLIFEETHPTLA